MLNKIRTDKKVILYFIIISLTALALGLSNDVISNYFKDAYNVTTTQRGLIEFPRETPGFLVVFVFALLSCFTDIRVSMIAQLLSIIGITVLGLVTPPFAVMLIFIFINSMGMHLFFPLQDSIGMSLFKDGNVGKKMGQYKSVSTAFSMLAGIMVFIGFKTGFFSFKTDVKWIFLISAMILVVVFILFFFLESSMKDHTTAKKSVRFIFRKEYKYYYTLVVMYGVQKQMMIVFGPWVLIEILGKKADTLALLGLIGSFIGIFFIPMIGKWLDRFGIKSMLYLDALSFIGVYIAYGLLSAGFASGKLAVATIPIMLTYALFIVDRMSNQMGMVRTLYLRSIAVDPGDITPTLSLGVTMDHVISILSSSVCGLIWTIWGPQYIFFIAAGLSFVNLYVATKVQNKKDLMKA